LGQINQQELQHLITVSTGFIDAYIIDCFDNVPMLLPQNIVLSAMDTETNVDFIEWHDLKLPVFAVNDPKLKKVLLWSLKVMMFQNALLWYATKCQNLFVYVSQKW
jgi:hypothetical protein